MGVRSEIALARKVRLGTNVSMSGRLLTLTRVTWLTVAFLEVALFVCNLLAPLFGGYTTICPYSSYCGYDPNFTVQSLQHAHIPQSAFDVYLLVLSFVDTFITVGAAIIIFWKKSDQFSGWLGSLLLLLFGGGLLAGSDGLPVAPAIFSIILTFTAFLCMGFFIVTFPDGRLIPRWSWLIGSGLFLQAFLYQLPGAWNLAVWPAPLFFLDTLLVFGSPVAVQIYRYRRISTPVQRQQTKWVLFSLICCVLVLVLQALAVALFPALNSPDSLYPLVSVSLIPSLSFLCIPVGITIAILRSRLWDVDTLINRGLAYGLLTLILGVIYTALVIGGEALLTGLFHSGEAPVLVLSTLVVAAVF